MSKFKVGDEVLGIFGTHKGQLRIVSRETRNSGWLQFVGEGRRNFNPACWELVEEDATKRRPHYDIIIAWAKGAEVEICSSGSWYTISTPNFDRCCKYRVKEDPKQSEIKSIREEMDKLASRLKELE